MRKILLSSILSLIFFHTLPATEYVCENDRFVILNYKLIQNHNDTATVAFLIFDKCSKGLTQYNLWIFDPDAVWPFDVEKIMNHEPDFFGTDFYNQEG